MKITSLIENTSKRGLPVEHGLCLHIRLDDGRNVLFDMGQSPLFAKNARTLNLSIADVDVAVVSHGHYDHGGGLETFLAENLKARVFIHRDSFQSHYSLHETEMRYIGLDTRLKDNERLVFCDGITEIGDGMTLFSDVRGDVCYPVGNRRLFGPAANVNDTFCHEQNLIIIEGGNAVLFAGCAHRGIVNIISKAREIIGRTPAHVFAGMHLVKSGLDEEQEKAFIGSLAKELQNFSGTMFHTMHCTGTEQFAQLKPILGPQIEYLSCGDTIRI